MRIMIFDTETIRPVLPKGETAIEGIQYAKDWKDYVGMGIAVIGAWDYLDHMPLVYTGLDVGTVPGDNFRSFQARIWNVNTFVTFNGHNFDGPLLAANHLPLPEDAGHYDILRELWLSDGLDPDHYVEETHSGYGLDACAKVNFGIGKSGDGVNAAIKWQMGKIGEVITYCLRDVMLTKRLFDQVLIGAPIVHPKTGKATILRHPFSR